jgi:hypothetical protein
MTKFTDAPDGLTGIPGVSVADLMYLAAIVADPEPRRVPLTESRMLEAAHSPRRLRRVLALADVPPDFRRRAYAIAAEARRRGTIPPPRACQRRARPVGAMRRGCPRRHRPGARRRTRSSSGCSNGDHGEPEPGRQDDRRACPNGEGGS